MLYCKDCNYYKEFSNANWKPNQNASMCEFANILFYGDVETLDIEYPCSKLSFAAYLRAQKPSEKINVISNIDWRFHYKKRQLNNR